MNAPSPATSQGQSTALWVIAGVLGFFMLVVVVLIGSFVWIGFQAFNEQAHAAIRANSRIQAAVGEIRDIRFDLSATGDAPGDEEFAFHIEGSRASGVLVGRFVTIDYDSEDLRDGRLILEDGRVVRIGDSARNDSGEADRSALEIKL